MFLVVNFFRNVFSYVLFTISDEDERDDDDDLDDFSDADYDEDGEVQNGEPDETVQALKRPHDGEGLENGEDGPSPTKHKHSHGVTESHVNNGSSLNE